MIAKQEHAATHLPILVRVFEASSGDVLELGTGYFSTLILDWLTAVGNRKFFSYENDRYWFKRAKKMQNSHHTVVYCNDLNKANFESKHWGLVFVDSSPTDKRRVMAIKLANRADYIIIHDTEPVHDKEYKFSKIWPKFKYVFHFKKYSPWTSVVSNFHDLSFLKKP